MACLATTCKPVAQQVKQPATLPAIRCNTEKSIKVHFDFDYQWWWYSVTGVGGDLT